VAKRDLAEFAKTITADTRHAVDDVLAGKVPDAVGEVLQLAGGGAAAAPTSAAAAAATS